VDNVKNKPAKAAAFFDTAPPRSSPSAPVFHYPHSWFLAGVGNWRGSVAAGRILTANSLAGRRDLTTAKTEDAAGYERRRA
jgi:hypothetical protein